VAEDAAGVHWRFRRRWARWVAALALLVTAVLLLAAWQHATVLEGSPRTVLNLWAAAALAFALALHTASLRWELRVGDDGIHVDRGSWMWPRSAHVPASALRELVVEEAYTVTTNGNAVHYHSVVVPAVKGLGRKLTPGVAGKAAAHALARRLKAALADRGHRFAAGGVVPPDRAARLQLLAWLGWAVVMGLVGWWLRR
jgi:hypothetical protein